MEDFPPLTQTSIYAGFLTISQPFSTPVIFQPVPATHHKAGATKSAELGGSKLFYDSYKIHTHIYIYTYNHIYICIYTYTHIMNIIY